MTICVASGKGGTGKTTVAVNLAVTLTEDKQPVRLLDCDVEEPNCHLFLQPTWQKEEAVNLLIPKVNEERCKVSGKCAEVCEYSAIIVLGTTVVTFPELCHGCGGCALACPENAITEVNHAIGTVNTGSARGLEVIHGQLNIGETKAPPVIRQVKEAVKPNRINIIDAPPGTSCPVIESMKKSDYVMLVTEPTPFGLNDLKLAVEAVREVGLPFGVVINRADIGDDRVAQYCSAENIEILIQIPDDKAVAKAYSRGQLMVDALPQYRTLFRELFNKINGGLAA